MLARMRSSRGDPLLPWLVCTCVCEYECSTLAPSPACKQELRGKGGARATALVRSPL